MREAFVQLSYLAASVLFILGIRSLTHPDTARRGMQQAAAGMVIAICGTLVLHDIVDYRWIAAGLIAGGMIGYPLGMWVPMAAMPQRIAISHMLGSLAAALVGIAEYYNAFHGLAEGMGRARMGAIGLEVLFGSLTVTGSFMACGKLQGFITERPVTYRGQNPVNISLFGVAALMLLYLIYAPAAAPLFYAMAILAALLGIFMVLPIGGADMPVVLSLLNSYTGLSAAATGFAIGNNVLIITGALDGASGFLLSILMCKAMNRSFTNILFGAFGGESTAAAAIAETDGRNVKSIAAEDAALQLAYAPKVIIVPGYGMAVAQCQHQVRELTELISRRGGDVKFAIHPVAGRMPGHMNVLLAEVDIPYDRLYGMEEINSEFGRADVALVIGANDVVNPAAKDNPRSPIYGMPILSVEEAKSVIVLKRSMNPGFAGIDNDLFYREKTFMLFGDAKASLTRLISEIKNA